MRKALAMLCFLIVALSVIWEVTMFFNNKTPKDGVREMEIEKSEGETEIIRINEEWVAVHNLRALVGSTIDVKPYGLDLRNGAMIESSPASANITLGLRWITIVVCLAAGICLSRQPKTVKPREV